MSYTFSNFKNPTLDGASPTVASIMINKKSVRNLPRRITKDERDKIKALCSYIGYGTRKKNDDRLPLVEISNENLVVMYRTLGFDFAAKYTILVDFLSRNDDRVSSWDTRFATIPTSRTGIEEEVGLKLRKIYFGTEGIVHKTTEQINPLYRNTLVRFGLIKEKVEKNVGFLCSISYPGGNVIQSARLSLFFRLNAEQRIVFCKRQLGMPYTDGYASSSTLSGATTPAPTIVLNDVEPFKKKRRTLVKKKMFTPNVRERVDGITAESEKETTTWTMGDSVATNTLMNMSFKKRDYFFFFV